MSQHELRRRRFAASDCLLEQHVKSAYDRLSDGGGCVPSSAADELLEDMVRFLSSPLCPPPANAFRFAVIAYTGNAGCGKSHGLVNVLDRIPGIVTASTNQAAEVLRPQLRSMFPTTGDYFKPTAHRLCGMDRDSVSSLERLRRQSPGSLDLDFEQPLDITVSRCASVMRTLLASLTRRMGEQLKTAGPLPPSYRRTQAAYNAWLAERGASGRLSAAHKFLAYDCIYVDEAGRLPHYFLYTLAFLWWWLNASAKTPQFENGRVPVMFLIGSEAQSGAIGSNASCISACRLIPESRLARYAFVVPRRTFMAANDEERRLLADVLIHLELGADLPDRLLEYLDTKVSPKGLEDFMDPNVRSDLVRLSKTHATVNAYNGKSRDMEAGRSLWVPQFAACWLPAADEDNSEQEEDEFGLNMQDLLRKWAGYSQYADAVYAQWRNNGEHTSADTGARFTLYESEQCIASKSLLCPGARVVYTGYHGTVQQLVTTLRGASDDDDKGDDWWRFYLAIAEIACGGDSRHSVANARLVPVGSARLRTLNHCMPRLEALPAEKEIEASLDDGMAPLHQDVKKSPHHCTALDTVSNRPWLAGRTSHESANGLPLSKLVGVRCRFNEGVVGVVCPGVHRARADGRLMFTETSLVGSAAMTIDRSQGTTLPGVFLDSRSCRSSRDAIVALSRTRDPSCLLLTANNLLELGAKRQPNLTYEATASMAGCYYVP